MKTALYRIWGNDDQLLYVGISKSALGRLGQHLTEKSWAADIANVTIETFATRELAAAAEVAAIKTEHPVHNVVHNQKTNKIFTRYFYYGNLSETRGLLKGQHVALAMKSGKCHVGHIYSIDGENDPHVELELKSWVTGYYGDGGSIFVRVSDIAFFDKAGFDCTGYVNDDHLGEFQTYWTNWYKDLDRPWPWGRA